MRERGRDQNSLLLNKYTDRKGLGNKKITTNGCFKEVIAHEV